MSMTTIEGLQTWDNRKILKFTRGSLFFADYATGTEITDPFTYDATKTTQAVSLATLVAGYQDPGYTDTNGVVFSRNLTVSDVMSWQSQDPTNSTIESDILTAKVVFQETNPTTLALYDNLELASAGDFTGTYAQARSQSGEQPVRRALFIAEALDVSAPLWKVIYLPFVKLTAIDDQAYQRTTETQTGLTLTAYKDTVLGASAKTWVGGPGWNALAPSGG